MNQIESDILEWIKKVSENHEELGGLSICPYALRSIFKIIECKAEEIEPIEGYDVVIFAVEDNLTLIDIEKWVDFYNQKHPEWKFFKDCKHYDSYINEIQTNNGKYNLILAQPKQKLRKIREKLAKTDYYSYWNEEYLKEILQDDIDLV